MGTDERPAPQPARRYLWWPLGVAVAWLVVVAAGVAWPPVLLGLPCVLVMVCVVARGPFRSGWLWSHAARAQLVATLVVELGFLVLARRYRSD